MTKMFSGCSSLKSLDLSSFNASNVTYVSDMFYHCVSLKKENVKVNDKIILDKLNK